MTTPKSIYATLLGGILLATTIPNVYANGVDYQDIHSGADTHGNSSHAPQPEKLPMFFLDMEYDQVEFFRGSYASITGFTILSADTYKLSLTDLGFPGTLKDIGAAVTTSSGKLGEILGTGSMLFSAQPGKYYLSIFADTLRYCDLGQFGLNLQAVSGAPSAVPVPGALWLFGSGLLGLAGMVRRAT